MSQAQDKPADKLAAAAEALRKEPFGDLVRKFALASVGAVVLAQEEIEEFVSKLVQKGELAEKDGKTLVKDLLEKRKQRIEAPLPVASNAITSAIDSTVDKVLHKINVPTKADVDELAKKIDDIDKKLEALAATRRSA
jgi:poly(hydroxyalkanoate) granule-associated protein